MSRENEKLNNVRRLAYCLYQRIEEPATIKQLATILHYLPEQLRQDIADLEAYTAEKVNGDREGSDNAEL